MPPQSSRLGWHAFLKLGLCLDLRAVVLTVCAWYLSNFWQQSRLWCGPVYQAHFFADFAVALNCASVVILTPLNQLKSLPNNTTNLASSNSTPSARNRTNVISPTFLIVILIPHFINDIQPMIWFYYKTPPLWKQVGLQFIWIIGSWELVLITKDNKVLNSNEGNFVDWVQD